MTDQVQGFGAQQEAGQPSDTLPEEQAAPESPQFVTVDFLQRVLDEKFTGLERRIQSMSDKQENRLKKEVEQKVTQLEENYRALGLQVPDGARQRLIDDTVLSFLENDKVAAQPSEPSPELVAYVNRRAQKIQEKAQVMLSPSDPEFALVKTDTLDPDEYLESWEKAVTSKANRLKGAQAQPQQAAQAQTNQPAMPPTNPAARVPMAGSGSPASSDNYQKYLAEVRSAPAGEAINIRRKWRPILRQEGIDL